MNNKGYIYGFLLMTLLLGAIEAHAQYDLKATWNEYEPEEIVADDPFMGSFTIMNYGDNTIPAGDTIWYGYIINGEQYDKELNLGLVSGIVLDEDFSPEDERSIYNSITWPLWGSGDTLDVCAVVYGVGFESYTGEFFTGDTYPENNQTCLRAVMPIYFIGVNENVNPTLNQVFVNSKEKYIEIKLDQNLQQNCQVELIDITGKVITHESYNSHSQLSLKLQYPDYTPKGLYFVRMSYMNGVVTKKIFLNNI